LVLGPAGEEGDGGEGEEEGAGGFGGGDEGEVVEVGDALGVEAEGVVALGEEEPIAVGRVDEVGLPSGLGERGGGEGGEIAIEPDPAEDAGIGLRLAVAVAGGEDVGQAGVGVVDLEVDPVV